MNGVILQLWHNTKQLVIGYKLEIIGKPFVARAYRMRRWSQIEFSFQIGFSVHLKGKKLSSAALDPSTAAGLSVKYEPPYFAIITFADEVISSDQLRQSKILNLLLPSFSPQPA